MLGIWNPHTLLMGINKATIILWKTVWQFLKRLTRWPNTSTPRCIQNRTEHTTQASTNVGSGMIPKSHKVKIPQVYINWRTDRQNALQPHSKSTTWVSLRNVTLSGRSQTHTQKGWFQHPKCPGRANCKDGTQIRDGAGVGVTAESACEQAQGKETLRGDAKVWNWLCWRLYDSVSLQKVTRSQVYKEWVVLHRTDNAIKLLWVK